MLKKVETIRTKCSREQLIKGLIDGWQKQFGKMPNKKSIAVLYAQNSLETGLTTSMWNWNLGNIKAIDNPNNIIEYCALNNVWEIINGKRIVLTSDNPGSWFRSFNSLSEGVAFHLDFLKNHRFKNAWIAVENGDAADFCHRLKLQNYYTAPEEDYIKGVTGYFHQFMMSGDYEKIIGELSIPTINVEDNSPTEPIIPIVFVLEADPIKPIENTDPIKLNWIQSIIDMILKIVSVFMKK
jgi:hypothetical protein